MTPEQFRQQGHALIDWIADWRAGLEARPVMSSAVKILLCRCLLPTTISIFLPQLILTEPPRMRWVALAWLVI